jgi:hypothetical protein
LPPVDFECTKESIMPEQPKASDQFSPVDPSAGQPNSARKSSGNEPEPLASLGAELLRRAAESQVVLETAWDELMAAWAIQGEPVGIAALRARIERECGTNPEDNACSRELIALREENRT